MYSEREESSLRQMFREDMYRAIVPMLPVEREKLCIAFVGPKRDVDTATTLLQSIRGNRDKSKNDLVCDVIETLVQHIAWNGIYIAKIMRSESGELHIHNCNPSGLLNIFGHVVQIIPKRERRQLGKSVVIVRSTDLWMVSVPDDLGGHRNFLRLLKQLDNHSSVVPDYWINNIQQGGLKPYGWYRRQSNIYHALATRAWGWDERDSTEKRWTEFYLIHRRVSFKYAQAILRDHCLIQINRLFRRLGLNVVLKIDGFLTQKEILDTRTKLLQGEISFTEVYDTCLHATLTQRI